MRLIDVHTHLGQFSNSRQSADGDTLCRMLRQAGISQAIAFSAEACYGGTDLGNAYTFQEVCKHEMLQMLLVVHPLHYQSSVKHLNEYADHPKVIGVKIHPHLGGYHVLDCKLTQLIEREIAPRRLPILSHVGNDAPNVQATDFFHLASRFPEIHFIAAHLANGILGNGQGGTNAWHGMQPKNVWLDMATLRAFHTGCLQNYITEIGEDRICFGTDAPLYWPAAFTHTLETIDLEPDVRERIAWKNALVAFPRLAADIRHIRP